MTSMCLKMLLSLKDGLDVFPLFIAVLITIVLDLRNLSIEALRCVGKLVLFLIILCVFCVWS